MTGARRRRLRSSGALRTRLRLCRSRGSRSRRTGCRRARSRCRRSRRRRSRCRRSRCTRSRCTWSRLRRRRSRCRGRRCRRRSSRRSRCNRRLSGLWRRGLRGRWRSNGRGRGSRRLRRRRRWTGSTQCRRTQRTGGQRWTQRGHPGNGWRGPGRLTLHRRSGSAGLWSDRRSRRRSSRISRGFGRGNLHLLGRTAGIVAVAGVQSLPVALVLVVRADDRAIAIPTRGSARIFVMIQPALDDDRDVLVDRARVRLFLLDAKLGQHIEDYVRLYLELPSQLIDSDFAHIEELLEERQSYHLFRLPDTALAPRPLFRAIEFSRFN